MNPTVLLGLGLVAMFAAVFVVAAILLVHNEESRGPLEHMRALLNRRPPSPSRSLHDIATQASEVAERSLDRSGRRSGVEEALEHAGVNMRAGEFVVAVAGTAFAAFAVGAALGGFLLAVILAVVVVAGSRTMLHVRVGRRRAKFETQLEQTLPLMAGSLRAGFGVMQTLDAVARESDSPTAEEFGRVVMESRLGRDLGDSLHALSERVDSEDFDFVVQAIDIHREVGGDLAEVLTNVASTIRDRNRVRRSIQTLTAEGRISAGILLALPIVMFFVVQGLNPEYLQELTGTSAGRVMLAIGIALMTVGAVWMRRLIRLVF
jgi:tight adherence protein B